MPTPIGGEVVWWCPSLDTAGNGTTTLNDFSGSGLNGTLTNFALSGSTSNWVADTANSGIRAIASDGSNDIITASAIPSLTGDCFWCAWFSPRSTTPDALILSTRNINTGASRNGITLYWRDNGGNNVAAEVVRNGTRYTATLSTTLTLNQWYFVWGQRLASTGAVTVGVDGVGSASVAGTTATITHEVGPSLCNWRDYSGGPLAGKIDDIRVFNRIPTTAEQTALKSKRGYNKPFASGGPINSQSLVRPAGDYRPQSSVVM